MTSVDRRAVDDCGLPWVRRPVRMLLFVVAIAVAGCGGPHRTTTAAPVSLSRTPFCHKLAEVYSTYIRQSLPGGGTAGPGASAAVLDAEIGGFASLAASAPAAVRPQLEDVVKKLTDLRGAVRSGSGQDMARSAQALASSEAGDLSSLATYEAQHCHLTP